MRVSRILFSGNKPVYEKLLKTKKPDVLVCVGPAGSGKTMLACKHAANHLIDKNYSKLIITRPTVTVDEDLGFLPGGIEDKMNPYLVPVFEQLEKYMDRSVLIKHIKTGNIELLPLGFIRGRTFDNTFIIADEMQNSSKIQMLTLLTRIGNNSKIVITGDTMQCDTSFDNGLEDLLNKYNNKTFDTKNMIKMVEFDHDDVERSELVKTILRLYS